MPAKAMNIQVTLPDSFELVSGFLSWIGDIPVKNEVPVIQSMVKSIKPGSWTIEVTSYIDPKEHGFFGGTGHNPIYVFVSENSAEWRLNPPYGHAGTSPLPPGQAPATSYTPAPSSPVRKKPSSPLKVNLSISKLPILNETCPVVWVHVSKPEK
jgi:hypothetical protein